MVGVVERARELGERRLELGERSHEVARRRVHLFDDAVIGANVLRAPSRLEIGEPVHEHALELHHMGGRVRRGAGGIGERRDGSAYCGLVGFGLAKRCPGALGRNGRSRRSSASGRPRPWRDDRPRSAARRA
jgi:hypothetical protein